MACRQIIMAKHNAGKKVVILFIANRFTKYTDVMRKGRTTLKLREKASSIQHLLFTSHNFK
jgi:hypothetical protein